MNNIQTPSKPDPVSKAKFSLICGIISILPILLTLITMYRAVMFAWMLSLITVPGAIIGIILGILALKSTKKNLAITGIILSLIGLTTSIYIYDLFKNWRSIKDNN